MVTTAPTAPMGPKPLPFYNTRVEGTTPQGTPQTTVYCHEYSTYLAVLTTHCTWVRGGAYTPHTWG